MAPLASVGQKLGVNPGTLRNWVSGVEVAGYYAAAGAGIGIHQLRHARAAGAEPFADE